MHERFATPKQLLQPRITTNASLKELEAAAERIFSSRCPPLSDSSEMRNKNSGGLSSRSNGAISNSNATEASGGSMLNGDGDGVGNGAEGPGGSGGGSALQQALALFSGEDYVLLPCDSQGALRPIVCIHLR